jgi:methyl coenzyme M reductase alpha subunit
MTGMDWGQMTSEERLIAEQAVLNFRELNKACDAAADGTVLNVCEKLAMQQGRELIRRTMEVTLNQQAAEVEKKGRRAARAAE